MGSRLPKQFLSLAGIPILVHTLKVFQHSPLIDKILLAVPEGELAGVQRNIVERFELSKVSLVLAGGPERQDSVRNALAHVSEEHDIVLVHDGVRPFVTEDLIERVVAETSVFGAATAGLPVRDTVKEVDRKGCVTRTVPRENLWLTQTPQAFRRELILAAYERAATDEFYGTDDASLVERTGIPVRMIPGDADNIKVTTPEDLERGEKIVCGREE